MDEKRIPLADVPLPAALVLRFQDHQAYDCSSSTTARTLRLTQGAGSVFLKIGAPEALCREGLLARFFAGHGLGPRVLDLVVAEDRAHLVLEGLEGRDGISPDHLAEPEALAEVFGRALRSIHALSPDGCPFPDRSREMVIQAEANLERGAFAAYLLPEGLEAGRRNWASSRYRLRSDTVIHGDFCLPNIVLNHGRVSGFIDTGNGGVGDPHYDLYWGLWTLEHNLKTTSHHRRFLDSYGRDAVDPEGIESCRLLSAFMD